MLIYLDTAVVIYAIEGAVPMKTRALARLLAAKSAGDELATTDLTRLECLVRPIRQNDQNVHAEFVNFLSRTRVLPISSPTYDRAAQIRAVYNLKLADSLHLAASILAKCDLFLTNDARLAAFPDIPVEILP